MRVEDKKKTKKGKSKKHKKRSSSTSSSSELGPLTAVVTNGAAKSNARRRRVAIGWNKKTWKNFSNSAGRRKSRSCGKRFWLACSMPSMPGKSAKQAQPASEPVDTVAEALSPKTKKVVLAQSRILTQDSVSKRLLEVTSWVDVQAQLSTQSAPDIKSLCAQICEHVPRNKSDCIVKKWTNCRVRTELAHHVASLCLRLYPCSIQIVGCNCVSYPFSQVLYSAFLWQNQGSLRHVGFLHPSLDRCDMCRPSRYLKVLAWDEYVLSHWLQNTTGIPVATVSAGTLLLGYKWISEGNAAVNGVRRWVRDAAQTPIRQAKKLATLSPDEGIKRALF